ncbi:uncharacterized protein LOC141903584 [Tubulanus polymorphus]|uniref:uncharacterized protein LOC141903584 n=1 Tax=Tubulanus polymorphus TaxID=672921 RepID=UPI003DA41C0F
MVGTPASPCIYCTSSGEDDDGIAYHAAGRITRSVCRSGHRPHVMRNQQQQQQQQQQQRSPASSKSTSKTSKSATNRSVKITEKVVTTRGRKSTSSLGSPQESRGSQTDLRSLLHLPVFVHSDVSLISTTSTVARTILSDDLYDISPKTGYTYAEGPAYSSNSIVLEVSPPNMSRARINTRRANTNSDMSASMMSEQSYRYRSAESYTSSIPHSGGSRASSEQPRSAVRRSARKQYTNQLGIIEDKDLEVMSNASTTSVSSSVFSSRIGSTNQMNNNNVDYKRSIDHGYGLDGDMDDYGSDTDSQLIRTTSRSSTDATVVSGASTTQSLVSSISQSLSAASVSIAGSTLFTWLTATFANWYWLVAKWTALDVWLLQKRADRSRCCGVLPFLLLFLLPLLLLGLYETYRKGYLFMPLSQGKTAVNTNNLYERTISRNQFVGLTEEQIEAKILVILAREMASYSRKADEKQSDTLVKQIERESQLESDLKTLQLKLNVLNNRIVDLDSQHQHFTSNINSMSSRASTDHGLQISAVQEQIKKLHADILRIELAQRGFTAQLKNCCKTDAELIAFIQNHVTKSLASLFSSDMGGGFGSTGSRDDSGGGHGGDSAGAGLINLGSWLETHFVSRGDLNALAASITKDILEKTEKSHHHQSNTVFVTPTSNITMSEQHVKQIVQEALNVFMADKTGMVDYALESSGGSIISTRCSETYNARTALIELFGLPLWYTNNSPRTAIQPDVNPGQCWAFAGTHGFLVIKLSAVIRPTAFTMEHIPKSISPSGKIDSAPKVFSVIGLMNEYDPNGKILGNYTYNENGPQIQTFPVLEPNVDAYPLVELQIHSNHGNEEYTCIYRFRVHGKVKNW